MNRNWLPALLAAFLNPSLVLAQARTEDLAAGLSLEPPKIQATLRMTRKTGERYEQLWQRYQDDAALPHHGERSAQRYLGKFGGRDALAAGDVLFTAIHDDGTIAQRVPILGDLGDAFLELLQAVDAVQSGSALDMLGFETDQFFRDRMESRQIIASKSAPPRHDPGVRLRLRGVERVFGDAEKVRVGVTFSDRIGQGPLEGWHAEGGVETQAKKGGEIRGFVGASRPWPQPHGRR